MRNVVCQVLGILVETSWLYNMRKAQPSTSNPLMSLLLSYLRKTCAIGLRGIFQNIRETEAWVTVKITTMVGRKWVAAFHSYCLMMIFKEVNYWSSRRGAVINEPA